MEPLADATNTFKASVHDGTKVPATRDRNEKLSRIGKIKGNI